MNARTIGRPIATFVAWATAFGVSQALGQPTPSEPPAPLVESTASPALTEARAAFQGGIDLAKEKRWASALQAFERSDALHPHAITTYNIGYCELQLRHLTRARKTLRQALADHRARGEVELPPDLVSAAETYLTDTDRQIARVVVSIARGAVTVDGRPLELAESGGPHPVLVAETRAVGNPEVPPSFTFEVLLDPGTHVFVLSVKGRADVTTSETFAPGGRSALQLRAAVAAAGSNLLARPPEKIPNRVPAFIAFGVGAAGLALGTVSGLVAFGKKDDVSRACQGNDPSACSSERDSGNRAADIATGSFIGAGVAVAVGALLFFTVPGSATSKAGKLAATNVRPVLSWPAHGLEHRF